MKPEREPLLLRLLAPWADKRVSIASSAALAGLALWDLFGKSLLGVSSSIGVVHGVAIHGVVLLLRNLAEFAENAGSIHEKHKGLAPRKALDHHDAPQEDEATAP
jgi:hypothetical protein